MNLIVMDTLEITHKERIPFLTKDLGVRWTIKYPKVQKYSTTDKVLSAYGKWQNTLNQHHDYTFIL